MTPRKDLEKEMLRWNGNNANQILLEAILDVRELLLEKRDVYSFQQDSLKGKITTSTHDWNMTFSPKKHHPATHRGTCPNCDMNEPLPLYLVN